MHRTLSAWLVITLASTVSAQATPAPTDPLVAARSRLQAALAKTAATPDTAFTAKWAEDGKKKDAGGAFVLGPNSSTAAGAATGSWHPGLVAIQFDGDTKDELLTAGRRTIAKAGETEWALRRGRYADGNSLDFAPDPEQLLEQLASWELAVVRRDTGSLDDRPMEVLTVTLNPDQVAALAWSGLVPGAIGGGGSNPFAIMVAMQQGGQRPAAPTPTGTVDLVITLDPATSQVHQLQFRSWNKQDQMVAGGRVMVFRQAGGQVQIGGNDEDDEEEAEAAAKEGAGKADAPLQYENGLPVRPRKKTTVMDFTLRLQNHGKASQPALPDKAKQLLRL